MTKIDEVLQEVKSLKVKLYGDNGFEGDITEIKTGLKDIPKLRERTAIHHSTLYGHGNDPGLVKQVEQTKNRLWKLAIVVASISATVGGGVAGLVQWLG